MDREWFLNKMIQMATPLLNAAAQGALREKMKLEQKQGVDRNPYACLEAVGRLLSGMSAWFESEATVPSEQALKEDLLNKAQLAIHSIVNPKSDDYTDYSVYGGPFSQLLVDAAFLAQALLRAPSALWEPLSTDTKERIEKFFSEIRKITPNCNNWMLFSTEVELLYRKLTGKCNKGMIKRYFDLFDSWYIGDSWYSDGPHFALDYYNSLVIHPMLLDLCDEASDLLPGGALEKILRRAQRHAEILERLVASDGSYPAIGRSLAYRCGVFHLLAQLAWQNRLPSTLSQAAVREVLFSVTANTLGDASFRADGFLNIGICGAQPGIGEQYICTGSLYLASAVFLILGIPETNSFWSAPAAQWTNKVIWSGADGNADKALEKR
jgi:hypothetical protein